MGYLDDINSPKDIKILNFDQLEQLASEIRKFLINSISKTGGHLASNLGVVELTLALHYCFDASKDKFVWDVGHQAYTHKILTGRKDEFNELRKFNGLSGFPKRQESNFDAFDTGHSSTSISAALGIAEARDLNNQDFNVVSIIGDGSMTGGLVYEAMNNAGRSKNKMLIVLNDNQMSISSNVGAMSKYLSELRTAPSYLEAKNEVYSFFENVPVVGDKVNKFLEKTKEGFKYALVPNVMFENLGIKYIGPIDGHDIQKLVSVINKTKSMDYPVLLHVITKKGKGYSLAESDPSQFHGISSFNISTGKTKSSSAETYSAVFGKALSAIAAKNNKVVAITAAMPQGTGLEFFAKTYPDRFFDVGIAEGHAVTFAAGLATNKLIPVFAVYSTFLQRAYDQILHDVCIQNLHVVFAVDRAGIVGSDGETHQGIYDLSFLSHIPNLTVMAPKDTNELKFMLDFAINKHNSPIAIRYPRGEGDLCFTAPTTEIEYPNPEFIFSEGDIAIISVGSMMNIAFSVYNKLKLQNIKSTLINARFISPISDQFIETLKKSYKYIFTIEDNILSGGYGSKLTQRLIINAIYDKIIYNFAFPDTFVEHGEREELFDKYSLSTEKIYNKIKTIIQR